MYCWSAEIPSSSVAPSGGMKNAIAASSPACTASETPV